MNEDRKKNKDKFLESCRRFENKDRDALSIAEADYDYGISVESIKNYMNGRYSIEQIRILSECYRDGADELAEVIRAFDLNCMQLAFESNKAGVSVKDIKATYDRAETTLEFRKKLRALKPEVPENATAEFMDSEGKNKVLTIVKELQEKQEKLTGELNDAKTVIERKEKEMAEARAQLLMDVETIKSGMKSTEDALAERDQALKELEELKQQVSAMNEKEVASGFPMGYAVNGLKEMMIESLRKNDEERAPRLAEMVVMKSKSKKKLLKLAVRKKLSAEQLKKIKEGLVSGLDEEQLDILIDPSMSPEVMNGIIDVAIAINQTGWKNA